MPMHRVYRLAGLSLCLIGFIPTSSLAAPNLTRATATVNATILAPISMAIDYDSSPQSHSPRVTISTPRNRAYQLQIGTKTHHSHVHNQDRFTLPHSSTPSKSIVKTVSNPLITLYFN